MAYDNLTQQGEVGEQRVESREHPDSAAVGAWYSATVLFKAVHPGAVRRRHLWERNTFLLRASEDCSIAEKAERIAREMEHEYESAGGQLVRWEFQSVEKIQELFDAELDDGTEVCWEFFERVDKAQGSDR